jgi:hypothetical protein
MRIREFGLWSSEAKQLIFPCSAYVYRSPHQYRIAVEACPAAFFFFILVLSPDGGGECEATTTCL